MIRQATQKDAQEILDIYNYYIEHSIATFAEKPMLLSEMETNLSESILWLVYEENGAVLGYASANKWKSRCAYQYSVESSVYIHIQHFRKGLATALYIDLLGELKKRKFHSVIGGVSLPNGNSVLLHEKFGFEKIAHFKEVGFKFNEWIDVGYWQLILK